MSHRLLDGAIFIADSHYSPKNPKFLDFLQKVDRGEIKTPQLILLGDNFDLLIPRIKKTVENNQEPIELIQKISKKIEVVYFEGNHDFLLKGLFKNAKVFSFFQQPIIFEGNGKSFLISHGDKSNNTKHTITTTLFRNIIIVNFLDFFTLNFLNNNYINNLTEKLQKKNICSKIKNFQEIIEKRLSKTDFNVNYVIEGHFHQGVSFDTEKYKYLNIESFACSKSYIVVEFNQNGIDFKSNTL
ncbi:MAG: metallophosphoesterase [Campylobacterales bacterium]|nr:metallophosphoesterase [Campylobacterales bacterium]